MYLGEFAAPLLPSPLFNAEGTCIGEMSPGSFDVAEYENWYLLKSGSSFVSETVDGVPGAELDDFPTSFPSAIEGRADIFGI